MPHNILLELEHRGIRNNKETILLFVFDEARDLLDTVNYAITGASTTYFWVLHTCLASIAIKYTVLFYYLVACQFTHDVYFTRLKSPVKLCAVFSSTSSSLSSFSPPDSLDPSLRPGKSGSLFMPFVNITTTNVFVDHPFEFGRYRNWIVYERKKKISSHRSCSHIVFLSFKTSLGSTPQSRLQICRVGRIC